MQLKKCCPVDVLFLDVSVQKLCVNQKQVQIACEAFLIYFIEFVIIS